MVSRQDWRMATILQYDTRMIMYFFNFFLCNKPWYLPDYKYTWESIYTNIHFCSLFCWSWHSTNNGMVFQKTGCDQFLTSFFTSLLRAQTKTMNGQEMPRLATAVWLQPVAVWFSCQSFASCQTGPSNTSLAHPCLPDPDKGVYFAQSGAWGSCQCGSMIERQESKTRCLKVYLATTLLPNIDTKAQNESRWELSQ